MKHLDVRSEWVVDTHDIRRTPGAMKTVQRRVSALADLGTEVIGIPEGRAIELDLKLESVMEGLYVSGSIQADATGACVRCLEPVDREVDVDVQELFVYADRAAHHQEVGAAEDEDDTRTLEGDLLDLEPMVRDAVVPALPYQPICRPDCPGLCSICGQPLAEDPDHQHDLIDPRWAALQQLTEDPTTEKRN